MLDDRYRVTESLGEGGMGAVFVAEHLKLRKSVAVKVIRAELAGNGEVAARFAREAMATAQFEHPHVASAIDFGTLPEGGAYFVMQLVRGESLRELLDRRGALPWPLRLRAARASGGCARGRAHGRHRAPRSEAGEHRAAERATTARTSRRCWISASRTSCSRRKTPDGREAIARFTRVGTIMGTPGYMSPEQAVGDRVDHRTDLYALGVVLWECLTGKALWDGPDVTTIITKQLRDRGARPRDVLGDPLFPRALDDLILRLCARSADERPEHAGLVRDELTSAGAAPVGACHGHRGARGLAAVGCTQALRSAAERASRCCWRRRAWPLAVVSRRFGAGALQPEPCTRTCSSQRRCARAGAQPAEKAQAKEPRADAAEPAPSLAIGRCSLPSASSKEAPKIVPEPKSQ